MVSPDKIVRQLNPPAADVRLVCFDKVDSTNDVAKRFVEEGVCDRLVVISNCQSSGRGRFERGWISPRGGLYASLITKPVLSPSRLPLMGMMLGLSAVSAIYSLSAIDVHLKWPNDIVVDDKKVGGILNEAVTEGDQGVAVILGIGINVNLLPNDYPEDLRKSITTILLETGEESSLEDLAALLLNEVYGRIREVETRQTYESILSEYKSVCNTLDRRVRVEQTDGIFEGTALNIDEYGALIVETEEGEVKLSTGDVVHLNLKT
ncbi:MAG: biotin--[acetyl-CoA-carboxylase] ligase [Candidatus Thorarchaeota archaeon]|nr:MAG: biotin--[acetyl-CoA-carboxylase] ligase [Candidatus Thorarchaeota archaeon]